MVRLYRKMLGRPADASALAAGTRNLGFGLLRRGQLRKAIASSPEYRALTPLWKRSLDQLDSLVRRFASGESDEAFLVRLYQEMLCRAPDASALAAGKKNLGLGLLHRDDFRKAIASSPEYRVLTPLWKRSLNRLDSLVRRFASGESDEAFVARLYQKMLCRAPDASALAAGTRSLGLSLLRRGQLRKAIASSPEYRALTPLWKRSLNRLDSLVRRFASGKSDEAFLNRLYEQMLDRRPDVAAVSAEPNLSLGLLRRGQLRKAIASSPEYRALPPLWKRSLNRLDSLIRRFASGKGDEAFLDHLYGQMLDRRPDLGAVSSGMRNLSRGFLRRSSLRKRIASSSEYRTVTTLRGIKGLLRDAPAPATDRSLAASPPEEIWLELTTRCNMVPPCAMCGYASADSREPRRDMGPRTWSSLLPLLRRAGYVGLHGAGEPLLYPFLGDLMEALHRSPAVVGFNSNGHLLTTTLSRRLVEKGLGWISFSLDAASALTYLRIRRRRDFETLLSKIQTLREIRNAAGTLRPQIEINMTLMKLNLPEAPAFVELAAKLGLDRVMFQEIQPSGSQRVVAPDGFVFDYREQELAGESRRDDLLGQARERARSLGLQFNCEILYGSPSTTRTSEAPGATERSATVSPTPACAEPWKRLLFDVHGNAFVCCIQKMNGILLGRTPNDALEEIWNGRRARLVREAMFGGGHPRRLRGLLPDAVGLKPIMNR